MPSISLGSARSVLECSDYAVSEVSIPAVAGALAPHRHEMTQLYLVLEGEYSESTCGRDFPLGPGSALFRPAGEAHSNDFPGDEVHGILIEFTPDAAPVFLPGLSPD